MDRTGGVLRLTLTSDQKYRLYQNLPRIAPVLIDATLAHEDKWFYWHPGINPASLVAAARSTYVTHDRRRGGSTITMQLARMIYGIDSRSIGGKLHQMARALFLEAIYSKDEILEAYLNLAPYGGNIEGVGAAAFLYFGKAAHRLTVAEALTLAVIPQSPSRRTLSHENGRGDALSFSRARENLRRMWLRTAKGENFPDHIPWPRIRRTSEAPFLAPHFVEDVLKRGYMQGEVQTTLDRELQQLVERILSGFIDRHRSDGITNGTVALLNYQSMELVALAGSANFFDEKIQGQVNGFTAFRSPGSTLKPFIYGLGMDQGLIHPRSLLKDAPVSFAAFDPENADNQFVGPISAHDALIRSRNIPAIELASRLKDGGLYQFMKASGVRRLKSPDFYGMSIAIGGAEVTMENLIEMYATLGNHGVFRKTRRVVTDPVDEEGGAGPHLLTPEAAFMVLQILRDNPRPGGDWPGAATRDRLPVYWKTGTSWSFRDAWSVGLVGPYVLAVWLGNFDNAANPALVGREAAAPLFFQLVDGISPRREVQLTSLDAPIGRVEKVKVCSLSGDLPGPFCHSLSEGWFVPKLSPIKTCTIHREVVVNPSSGLRTCGLSPGGVHQIAEFWPSDLMKLFAQAGLPRRLPPAYEPNCSLGSRDARGSAPRIRSPREEVVYEVNMAETHPDPIAFQGVTDSSSRRLYWYVGRSLIGSSRPGEPLYWTPTPGEFLVRAVDDLGRASERKLVVEGVSH